MIDRAVITVFPGYCLMSVLCIRSIVKYFSNIPITIIIDDFDLNLWPDFSTQYQQYIISEFEKIDITFANFSYLSGVDDAKMGGWFRQQLIKLHTDIFVDEKNILLIDADVILEENPKLDVIPANVWPSGPINSGFHLYIEFMLGRDPWLGTKNENLCASWVPVRFVTQDLLKALRRHVEQRHGKNFLDLHIDLMKQQKIVAFDPNGKTMIMSEFEMLEVFRRYLWSHPMPIVQGAGAFYHTSEKDWKRQRSWFEDREVSVPDELWHNIKRFGSNQAIQ